MFKNVKTSIASMKTLHRVVGSVVIIILLIVGTMLLAPYISSPEQVRNTILNFKYVGWLIYILLVTVAGPLPIPSPIVVIGGGYIYGTLLGSLLSYVGIILGGIISFYMIRFGGRLLLEKLVDHHHRINFYHLINERGHIFVLFAFAIPIFPSDVVCLLLGLTHIKFRTLLWLLVLGSIPRALLVAALGSELSLGFSWRTMLLLAIVGVGGVIALFRERIKKFLFHELHEVEHLVQQAEKYESEL